MEYREVEVKLRAETLDPLVFESFVWNNFTVIRHQKVMGPDVYYRDKVGNVVRFRHSGDDVRELTIKKRSSEDSIVNRLEIDLPLGAGADINLVSDWIEELGFSRELTIVKDASVYWIEMANIVYTIVLYDCYSIQNTGVQSQDYRFIEIELDKKSGVTPNCVENLNFVKNKVAESLFKGEAPTFDLSLFEFFSGKRYLLEGGQNA